MRQLTGALILPRLVAIVPVAVSVGAIAPIPAQPRIRWRRRGGVCDGNGDDRAQRQTRYECSVVRAMTPGPIAPARPDQDHSRPDDDTSAPPSPDLHDATLLEGLLVRCERGQSCRRGNALHRCAAGRYREKRTQSHCRQGGGCFQWLHEFTLAQCCVLPGRRGRGALSPLLIRTMRPGDPGS